MNTGSVVVVEIKNNEILVKKPKSDLKNLFGSWSDVSEKEIKKSSLSGAVGMERIFVDLFS